MDQIYSALWSAISTVTQELTVTEPIRGHKGELLKVNKTTVERTEIKDNRTK